MSTEHILYIIISLIAVTGIVVGGSFIKKQKYKDCFLTFWALACFFIHISCIYVTFFDNIRNGNGEIGFAHDNHIFPIYFCNFIMYLQLVASFWFNKESKFYKNFATFTAWGGIFGALITLFITPPGIHNWSSFQSALSHSCLLITSLYLFAGGYVKLNVFNIIPYSFGLLASGAVGGLTMLIYYLNGVPIPNAMYLLHGPVEVPVMHGGYIALIMLVVMFIFLVIWEQFTRKSEDRWYKTAKDIGTYLPIKKWQTTENVVENN